MKKVTVNKVIDLFLFIYVLSLYFLTQQQGLNLISNVIALTLISTIWVDILLKKKKIRINNFLMVYLLFIFICSFSVLYSIESQTALIKSRTLILNFILMFSLTNYINSVKKIENVLYFFAISGFLTSIYLLLTTNFSSVTRIGRELGNQNAIGIIIALSTVICFYFVLKDAKHKLLPVLVINITAVLLTGSRQALLFLVASMILFLFFISKGSVNKKVKYLSIGLFGVICILYLVYNIPIFYEVIGSRIDNLLDVVRGQGTTEGSLNIRNYMREFGINKFKDRPLLGYGIGNYSVLLNKSMGVYTYAHNNIIELLVGIGLLGTFIYYYAQFIIIKDLFKTSNYDSDKNNHNLNYLFVTLILIYILISISTVYYDNKVFNIILTISSVLPYVYFKEKSSSAGQKVH